MSRALELYLVIIEKIIGAQIVIEIYENERKKVRNPQLASRVVSHPTTGHG